MMAIKRILLVWSLMKTMKMPFVEVDTIDEVMGTVLAVTTIRAITQFVMVENEKLYVIKGAYESCTLQNECRVHVNIYRIPTLSTSLCQILLLLKKRKKKKSREEGNFCY